MTAGTSLLLIAAGAILRYAVTATTSGIDLQTVGLVLMIVGIVGLVLSLMWMGVWSRSRGGRAQAEAETPPEPGPRY
jgi:hypothetical protein